MENKNVRDIIQNTKSLMEFTTDGEFKKNKAHYERLGNNVIYKVGKDKSVMTWSLNKGKNIKKYNNYECCYELCEPIFKGGDPYVYLTKWKGKGKWYGAILVEDLKTIMPNDTGLYEILRYDRPRRLYADIEFCSKDNKSSKSAKERANTSIAGFKQAVRKICPEGVVPYFVLSYSRGVDGKSGLYKYSVHIVCPNVFMTGDKNSAKFLQYLENEGVEIDKSVYSKNQLFKFPYQLKDIDRNKGFNYRKQIPIPIQTDLKDFIIQYIPKDAVCVDDILEKIKIVKYKLKDPKTGKYTYKKMKIAPSIYRRGSKKGQLYPMEVQNLNRKTPFQVIQLFDSSPECLCGEAYWRIMVFMVRMKMSFQNFLDKFNQPYRPKADATEEKKRENKRHIAMCKKHWDKISEEKTIIRLEAIKNILKAQYPNFRETDETDFLDGVVNEDNCIGEKTIIPTTQEWIKLEDLENEYLAEMKYLCLNGCLGSGKTQASLTYMKKMLLANDTYRIIFICNRITLKTDIAGQICDPKKYDLGKYLRDYKDIISGDEYLPSDKYILMTTLESLWHFDVENYDLVVIDECESVYKTLLTFGTILKTNYQQTAMKFIDLLKSAKKVFLLDGLLMTRTYKLIKNIEGQDYAKFHTIITKEKNKQSRRIRYYKNSPTSTSYYTFMNDLIKYLSSGKRAFVFMPHKCGNGSRLKVNDVGQGVYLLKALFINHTTLEEDDIIIHAGSHKNNKYLVNVNAFWKDGRLVLTTACITNGVSYDRKGKEAFDGIWILNDSGFIDGRDIAQVIGRNRHPNEVLVRYCDLNYGRPPMAFEIPDFARPSMSSKYNVVRVDERYEEDVCEKLPLDFYKKCIADLHHDLSIEYYCKDNGITLQLLGKIDMTIKETIIASKETEGKAKAQLERVIANPYEFEPYWEWENIKDIDKYVAEEYFYLNKRGKLEDEERFKLEKYNFVHQFNYSTDPKLLEDLWERRKAVDGFNSLLFDGRHPIQYCFKFYDGKSGRRHKFLLEMIAKKQIKSKRGDITTEEYKQGLKKRYRLKPVKANALLAQLNTGTFGLYSNQSLIDKAVAFYLSTKYFDDGKFVEGQFYSDLHLFCQAFNPTKEVRLPFHIYEPYTTTIHYRDGRDSLVLNIESGSSKKLYEPDYGKADVSIRSWKDGTTMTMELEEFIEGKDLANIAKWEEEVKNAKDVDTSTMADDKRKWCEWRLNTAELELEQQYNPPGGYFSRYVNYNRKYALYQKNKVDRELAEEDKRLSNEKKRLEMLEILNATLKHHKDIWKKFNKAYEGELTPREQEEKDSMLESISTTEKQIERLENFNLCPYSDDEDDDENVVISSDDEE